MHWILMEMLEFHTNQELTNSKRVIFLKENDGQNESKNWSLKKIKSGSMVRKRPRVRLHALFYGILSFNLLPITVTNSHFQ